MIDQLMVLAIVCIIEGFILGFYVCYSGWVIGGEDATFKIISKLWRGNKK
jgi:hypothetical protein